jgi:hypothetical protein
MTKERKVRGRKIEVAKERGAKNLKPRRSSDQRQNGESSSGNNSCTQAVQRGTEPAWSRITSLGSAAETAAETCAERLMLFRCPHFAASSRGRGSQEVGYDDKGSFITMNLECYGLFAGIASIPTFGEVQAFLQPIPTMFILTTST